MTMCMNVIFKTNVTIIKSGNFVFIFSRLTLYGLILDEKMAHTFNPSGFYPDQGPFVLVVVWYLDLHRPM